MYDLPCRLPGDTAGVDRFLHTRYDVSVDPSVRSDQIRTDSPDGLLKGEGSPVPASFDDLPGLSVRHLLGISDLSRSDIIAIINLAFRLRRDILRPRLQSRLLEGRTVVNLFTESSTRTRSSFELAERRIGATPLNFNSMGSSFSKGETLLDTVRNVEAMHVDAIVVRHSTALVPWFLAAHCSSTIINAGDGRHEHPTQALLDVMTLLEIWRPFDALDGTLPDEPLMAGRRVCIIGDILHGRVAMSNVLALQALGAEVAVCGPPTLIPRGIEGLGVRVFKRLEDALAYSDAVNMLRIQRERQDRCFFPSTTEYARLFGLNRWRMASVPDDLVVLHPGPINRGIELDSETADGDHAVILQQVENGVAVRMAVLALLLGRR